MYAVTSTFFLAAPDFSRYQELRTLLANQFPLGLPVYIISSPRNLACLDDPQRRVIIVGDLHGMQKQLRFGPTLLRPFVKRSPYNP